MTDFNIHFPKHKMKHFGYGLRQFVFQSIVVLGDGGGRRKKPNKLGSCLDTLGFDLLN